MAHVISMPTATLLGALLIASATYLGLRERSASASAHSATHTGTDGRRPRPVAAAPSGALRLPEVPGEVRKRVVAEASQTIDALRSDWIVACADGKPPGEYRVELSFDAGGKLRAWGLSEQRDRSDPQVARCLRSQPLAATVAAPGSPVAVELVLHLP